MYHNTVVELTLFSKKRYTPYHTPERSSKKVAVAVAIKFLKFEKPRPRFVVFSVIQQSFVVLIAVVAFAIAFTVFLKQYIPVDAMIVME